MGVVTRQGFAVARGGEPVPREGDEREQQHERRRRPQSRGCGRRGPRGERLVDPFHQSRDAHPHPHAPCGERRDEEIVALAHLVLQPRSAERLRIAPLEVEIENERHGEGQDQRRHGDGRPAIGAPVAPRPEQPQRSEQHRQPPPDAGEPVPAELPGEVLHVVQELLPVQDERVARVVGAGRKHRVVEYRGLAELIAREHRFERRPGRCFALVEIWVEVRPNRNEEVDAQPDHHYERRCNEKPRTQQGARLGEEHVHEHGRRREDAHEMVGRREGEQVDDEDEVMIAPGAHRLVRPPYGEPEHQGDRQDAQGIDLLIHHRLVPHGERRRPDDGTRARHEPPPLCNRHDGPQPALSDQEP